MKLRPLLTLAAFAAILSSCGINDLEDRLDKVENALGTDEPIRFNFTTTNYEDAEIAKNASYSFKSSSYYTSYMWDYGDGEYYIFVQRLGDVTWEDDAWIEFNYNTVTKEVSNAAAYLQFRDQSGQRINPTFDPDNAGHTFELKVHSFNGESGKIEVEVIASTDETASNNEYEGKAMSVNMKFKGKLGVFLD